MSVLAPLLILLCVLTLGPGSARGEQVILVDLLDSTAVSLFELNGGTQIRSTPLRGLPADTFLRRAGLARDPTTGDMFLMALFGPQFGPIPETEPTRLFRVADDGTAQMIGPILPNRANPSLPLRGFAIDSGGFGYALQRSASGSDYDRVVFFQVTDPAVGGELNPGLVLNAVAFHQDESRIYVFGSNQNLVGGFATIQPMTPTPKVIAGKTLVSLDDTFVDQFDIFQGGYVGSNRFLFGASGVLVEVSTAGPDANATIRDLGAEQPQLQGLGIQAEVGGLAWGFLNGVLLSLYRSTRRWTHVGVFGLVLLYPLTPMFMVLAHSLFRAPDLRVAGILYQRMLALAPGESISPLWSVLLAASLALHALSRRFYREDLLPRLGLPARFALAGAALAALYLFGQPGREFYYRQF